MASSLLSGESEPVGLLLLVSGARFRFSDEAGHYHRLRAQTRSGRPLVWLEGMPGDLYWEGAKEGIRVAAVPNEQGFLQGFLPLWTVKAVEQHQMALRSALLEKDDEPEDCRTGNLDFTTRAGFLLAAPVGLPCEKRLPRVRFSSTVEVIEATFLFMSSRTTPQSLFNARLAGRREARDATMNFEIRSLTKAGVPSKARTSDFGKFKTREEAEAHKAYVEGINPGRSFVITNRAGEVV